MAREARRHRFDRRGARQHADLDGANRKIGEYRVHLRQDEVARHVADRRHALRVLRGQRGDDAGAIDAERREGFEIRLDAGAAARVGARDGERDRRHDLRRSSAPSTTARSSRAAFPGSALRDSAEITATPSTPASTTAAALTALMPAMAQMG